jgi:hypothetical protein
VFLSCAGVKIRNAGVPVYSGTQERKQGREACILLISLGETKYKIPGTCAPWHASTVSLTMAIAISWFPGPRKAPG